MTVCVAAISDRSSVIGVTDRMLTAGDVEFEPAQAKMWPFSTSVWGLLSGDYNIQAEILGIVDTEVKRRIAAQPDVWVSVKEIAELYCKRYRELLRARAEAAILHPLGLDVATFLAKQASMSSDIVVDLAAKLTAYSFDSSLETLLSEMTMTGQTKRRLTCTFIRPRKTNCRTVAKSGSRPSGSEDFMPNLSLCFLGIGHLNRFTRLYRSPMQRRSARKWHRGLEKTRI